MTTLKQKRKKNLIAVLSVIVVLVVLVVAVKLLTSEKSKDEDTEGVVTEAFKIATISESSVKKIDYVSDGKTFSFAYENDAWTYTDDKNFPLDQNRITSKFLDSFFAITSERKITVEDGSYAKYGLDNPSITLTFTDNNKIATTYLMGSYNSVIGGYYVTVKDSKEIYVIDDTMLQICRDNIYDFATVETIPSFSTDALNSLSVTNNGVKVRLLLKTEGDESDLTGYAKWFFKEPFQNIRGCESGKINNDDMTMFTGLQYTKMAKYNPTTDDLTEYGIKGSNNTYELSYKGTDEEGNDEEHVFKLSIGKLDDTGSYYYVQGVDYVGLIKNQTSAVYLMDTSLVTALLAFNPMDYLFKYVAFVKLDDIANSSIDIKTPDKSYKLEYKVVKSVGGSSGSEESTDGEAYYVDGELMDSTNFKTYYTEFIKLSAERIIYDQSTVVEGEPDYTFVYHRVVDDVYGEITVKFIPYNVNYYEANINGVTEFLVNKRDVKNLITDLESLKAGTYNQD